ncbi:TetR/AcrR family transcriptional regulator [Lacrimispora sp.]|uniref:TetR/AcrR family transcriptional regulator n=1 Tax=Lacrimispora sp. TaxID=2719234 RepID=UPI00289E4499|nr:TetR/AcrR family transcriptional regulator [Lacrimispora sp.]
MGIRERRDVEKEEMKKKIMDAAMEVIGQEGYEKLSIRKIAAKIEYSPTTIYLYYKDKAEIITDMSDVLYRKVMGEAVAVINEEATLPIDKQVHDILRVFIRELCSEPEMVKAIMHSGLNVVFANDSTDGKPTNPGIDMLDHLVSDGITQKVFRPGIENNSWMIVSALLGFVLSSIGSQLYLFDDFHKHIDDFVEILMGGIKQ